MGEGDNFITVGNKSYPSSGNEACIKSFEVGWIDTHEINLEILDEAGGRMQLFVDSIRKNTKETFGPATRMRFQFGWTMATCDGQKKTISSRPYESSILEVQVNYSEGKIKYNIKAGAHDKLLNVIREDVSAAEDDKKIKLEEAIRNLAAQCPPINVKYCKRDSDGKVKCEKFKWNQGGYGGPLGTWQADNQNRVAVISKWVEPFRVEDGTPYGLGIIPIWEPTKPDVLVLMADPSDTPAACSGADSASLGTFIVNGGKCSPVIEFTPTFNWISGMANFNAGGDTSGPGTTKSNFQETKKRKGQEKEHCDTTGAQQQNTITQQAWGAYGPKNAWDETMKSSQAHAKAARLTEVSVEPIEATLKILGDPREKFNQLAVGTTCSIVAINPFHLSGAKNNGCGDWLADPPCNGILSNKNWTVLGINHSIKEGSYTTTLKLRLGAPGINVNITDPLGGSGSCGTPVKNAG